MTSCYVITERATSTGNSVMRFTSQSRQPLFAVRKQQFRHHAQLTVSRCSVTKTDSLSNMLRVQKGQRQRMDTVTYMVQGTHKTVCTDTTLLFT